MKNSQYETDPVCGVEVAITEAAAQSTYGQRTYYFCGAGCKTTFDSAPELFELESNQNRAAIF